MQRNVWMRRRQRDRADLRSAAILFFVLQLNNHDFDGRIPNMSPVPAVQLRTAYLHNLLVCIWKLRYSGFMNNHPNSFNRSDDKLQESSAPPKPQIRSC